MIGVRPHQSLGSRERASLRLRQRLQHEDERQHSEHRVEAISEVESDARQQRERPRDDPVSHPIDRRADGDGGGSQITVEQLAKHHPHHRSPSHAERDGEHVDCDESSDARTATQAHVVAAPVAVQKHIASVPNATAMTPAPARSIVRRPTLSMIKIATTVEAMLTRTVTILMVNDGVRGKPDQPPQCVRVSLDDVDADELLERGE